MTNTPLTLTDLFKGTPAKPKQKRASKPKPTVKTASGRTVKLCDLCGRGLTRKGKEPYEHAIWCVLCIRNHKIYPDECATCEGYHFPPGITPLDYQHPYKPVTLLAGETYF